MHVTEKTFQLQKTKSEASKKQIEESKRKEKTFVRQQGYLKDQLRQQMSRRAEVLEDERRKAGLSLEGLKTKLKQLEQVITRKDSAVQDFRLELAKSRVEKEKSVDMEREMDELKRRLQDVENERDTVKTQLSHFSALGEHVGPINNSKGLYSLQQKLDNVASKLSIIETTRDEEDARRVASYPRVIPHASSRERVSSWKKRTNGNHLGKNTRNLRDDKQQFYEFGLDADYQTMSDRPLRPTVVGSNDGQTNASFSDRNNPVRIQRRPKYVSRNKAAISYDGSEAEIFREDSSSWRLSNDRPRTLLYDSRDTEESLETRTSFQDKRRPYLARGRERHLNYGPLSSTKKSKEKKKDDSHGENTVELESSESGLLTISSIADDKKTKFLASVNRLKNEKVRELEIGLQHFLKH